MKIGILGGIGVEATGYFYLSVVRRLQTNGFIRSNTDYPNFIINSVPAPELHLDEHDTPEILEHYIEGVRSLSKLEPDFIIMVCNTIHLYLDTIKAKSGHTTFLSLIDIVKDALQAQKPKSICVLGTGLTIKRGLYSFPEYEYVALSASEQDELCHVVSEFNRLGSSPDHLAIFKQRLMKIVMCKQRQGAETFIFACTEVSEILSNEGLPSLDTLELLIEATSARICSPRQ